MSYNHKAIHVDTFRCVGCHACEAACKVEHNIPPGPKWIEVIEVEKMVGAEYKMFWKPMACFHCGEPDCLPVCPTKAISKREEDGIVMVSKDLCIGCMECFRACPFGAPQLGFDGKMEKCNLCVHKTAAGGVPACVTNCPSEAMFFGTTQELSSMVRKKHSVRSVTVNGAGNPSVGGANDGRGVAGRTQVVKLSNKVEALSNH